MMKHSLALLLLASLIGSVFYQSAQAALAEQCSVGFLDDNKLIANGDLNKQPVQQAKPATTHEQKHAMFSNNSEIQQRKMTLTANELQLTQRRLDQNKTPLCTITATGNVNYASNEIKLHGTKAWFNLNNKDIDVNHGYYYMVGRPGRGDAAAMKRRGNRYTILENGSFTSCIKGDNSWSLVSSEFIHDKHWQCAKIWNARFKIGKVPVFYSPYLQIPVGDKRRSGLMIPHAKYGSHHGLEFSTPYYLNLAPNYDATITPKYLSKRGIQMQTELRYLTIWGKGLFEFDWLPKERFYRSDNASDDHHRNRWLLHWHHNGVQDKVWRLNVDYTKVSDYNYFDDLDSKYGSTTDGYAIQKFSLGYTKENLDAALSYKQFQLFDKSSAAYNAAPQLDLTYYKHDLGPFNLKVFSQAAKFTNLNQYYPESYRLHIEPTLNLPITNSWGKLSTETKLMATHYYQENIDDYNKNISTGRHLKGVINRVLPQFKTDGSLVFERNMNYAPKYMQTLEMRLQYLYVPYRYQNDIGVYDSTILQTNYYGMFSDRTYSGLDRISSANQLMNSFTTRIYDAQYAERLNASVSKIYYFSPPSTGDITSTWNNIGSWVWAGDSSWRISNQWGVRGNLQYESCLNRFTLGHAVLEYKCNNNRILQLNYRYVSKQYLEKLCSGISHNGYTQGISQVGVIGIWPLVKRLSIVGAYYHDHNTNQPTNQLISLQYNNCCWAINMNYERKITGWNTTNSASNYDNKVSFKIELRGLNSNSGLVKNQMLISGMLPNPISEM
ncbi:conserved hypothetical protein MEPCIT_055 [Candidatus Moranella endobia PCIT]|uniref:LPS-assembly protein LptD n=2 Tax=Candidatus Moranella TaxID=1048757 RepID=F7XX90_MOREP|nr:conserved hypothetical protein MEPCIT_055 [Candidatus Moranella endobia PCIT]